MQEQIKQDEERVVVKEIIGRMRKEYGFSREQALAVIEAQAILGMGLPEDSTLVPVDAEGQVLIPSRLAEIFVDPRFLEMLLATQQFQRRILDYFIFADPNDCDDEEEVKLLQEKINEIAQEILDLDNKITRFYSAITKPEEHEVSLFNQIGETRWYQAAFKQMFQFWQIMTSPPDLWPNDPPIWTYETEMMLQNVATAWYQSDQSQSAYRFPEIKLEDTRNLLLFLQWFVEHQLALPQVNVVELNELHSEIVSIAYSILAED